MNTNYKPIIVAISLVFALSVTVSAAPADLDPTFGSGGIVITRGSNFNHLNAALAMAIQADGKIVVVGDGSISGPTWDFAVVRYNIDGSLDTSFGGAGIVITPVGNSHDAATSVAIQADGKIVAAGTICNGVGNCSGAGSSFAVVRYNTDGSLDTSFNGTGKVITSVNSSHDYAFSLAIQTDSKIVVAGTSGISPSNFAIVRYNANGTLDTSFNGTGKVIPPIAGGIGSVAIQSDGKIIAAGESQDCFTIIRYNPDGSLDTSFNGTGKVFTSVGNSYSGALELAIQTDGKMVVAGYSVRISSNLTIADFALVRYNPNGSLDTSFNGTGKVITSVNNSDCRAHSVAIQSDGKIVAAGYSRNDIGSDFAVVRFNQNGSLDTTFNGTGKVTTAFGGQDYAIAVAIQPDGKIVAAGGTDNQLWDFYDFAVVRYQGDDATPACPNPIDCADFFVRQHYLDFLNREPDPAGFAGWQGVLNNCLPGDTSCDRIHVSSAFFQSPEFQQRGYFVYRFYPVALGRKPDYNEFTPDLAKVTGFLTDAQLEAAKTAFIAEFMSRPAFVTKFNDLDNTAYVDSLLTTAGITHPARDLWIAALAGGTRTRAQVLREIVESTEVFNKYFNQAFVVMQYFGYLRRDPDILYLNWIAVLEANPADSRHMIAGFVNSIEYRARFGSP